MIFSQNRFPLFRIMLYRARSQTQMPATSAGMDATESESGNLQFKRMMLPAVSFSSCASLDVAGRISLME